MNSGLGSRINALYLVFPILIEEGRQNIKSKKSMQQQGSISQQNYKDGHKRLFKGVRNFNYFEIDYSIQNQF
ncbi:unnamed protein product [Paramecium primaurelia]|uniref:Uncharacterized protein n=1 Tax=Paramecium primaurelia TaxID=5886 RepID=A0A8S1N7M3_PARPR|nr:unnamed protein product [Paramecium primaurelia]